MLNLAEQSGIGRIEAKLNGVRGVTEPHNTIGKPEALTCGDEK